MDCPFAHIMQSYVPDEHKTLQIAHALKKAELNLSYISRPSPQHALSKYNLPALSSQLSVFSKLSIMNIPLHFLLLLCQLSRSLKNVSYGGRVLSLIKSAYHGWVSMMTSSYGPPLFSLALGLPNLKPTTGYFHLFLGYTLSSGADPASKVKGGGGRFQLYLEVKSYNSAATVREMKYTSQHSCDKTMDHPQNDLIRKCCFSNCTK